MLPRTWQVIGAFWTVATFVSIGTALTQQEGSMWRWLFVVLCAVNAVGGWLRAYQTGDKADKKEK